MWGLKLYEILCPDGFVKNGYDKSKLTTIFANSMNNAETPNKDFSHIDDSDGDKIAIFDFSSYPSNSIFEIHLNDDSSPKHLASETINYLEAYKRTGQLIDVILVTDDKKANRTLSDEETKILNKITDKITYK